MHVSTANAPKTPAALAALTLGALGVVYGDIGTSPLYALKEVFHGGHVATTDANILGVLSLVFWTMTIIVSLKYVLLILRACGESHDAAHALGYRVLRIRFLAILFGGACAGLAGAYLSLVLTPFWSSGMTGGRGWIALAIVVFASWLPWRAAGGAYLFGGITILQLHAQALGVPVPSQLLAALPYLITIIVLVVIMAARRGGTVGPGSLGVPFVPDR